MTENSFAEIPGTTLFEGDFPKSRSRPVKEQERQMIPLGRRGDPDDVARWVVDLLRSREELDHWTDRSGGWRLGNYLSPDAEGANRQDHRHTDRRPQKVG